MSWNNIVIESFCFGEEKDGKYPCGKRYPTESCLDNGHCPHLGYSESNEREAAKFVPFRIILWDRLSAWLYDFSCWLSWFFWGQLWFNRRKTDAFFDSIGTATIEDSPALAEFEAQEKKCADEFPEWFAKAQEENP